ncbi:MAG: DHHA1 domain-containing protein [Clostridiales bacterium]|nr:DHHA1 domain-containing protein [Clostridiales bacterium]
MTERLYYEDVTQSVFEATVTKCRKGSKYYEVVLDRTCFYPEGGGQPADVGTIPPAIVYDVQEVDGEIVHYIDKPLEVGSKVTGLVDMIIRHRLMQQHSGEHIVSGLIHDGYGFDNVGFHMGSECITIDFNGILTEEELSFVEEDANEAIYKDFEPEIFYPTPEELQDLEYRSKKALEGDVRIVRFPDYDTCACCGLHVRRTGEIGVIKITGMQRYKGGTRITMLAGAQAREDYAVKDKLVHEISQMLSAKPYEINEAVQRLKNEREEIKEELVAVKTKLFELKRDNVPAGEKCAVLFEDLAEPFEIRVFAEMLLEKCPTAAVLSGNDDYGYRYAIASREKDVVSFVKGANKVLNGRGGGKDNLVQGSFMASAEEIERYIRNELS